MRSRDREQPGIPFIKCAIAFIDRLQHAYGPVFDRHGHTEQALHFKLDMIGNQGIMARILFHVVQNNMLVRAEDCSGEAVLDRNRDFRQLSRVRACRGGKVQARIFSSYSKMEAPSHSNSSVAVEVMS